MPFPIRTCVVCGEEFELKPGKPGFANRCPSCSEPEEPNRSQRRAAPTTTRAPRRSRSQRRAPPRHARPALPQRQLSSASHTVQVPHFVVRRKVLDPAQQALCLRLKNGNGVIRPCKTLHRIERIKEVDHDELGLRRRHRYAGHSRHDSPRWLAVLAASSSFKKSSYLSAFSVFVHPRQCRAIIVLLLVMVHWNFDSTVQVTRSE